MQITSLDELTDRQYVDVVALAVLPNLASKHYDYPNTYVEIAAKAYKIAEAMVAERNKRKGKF